MAQLLQLINVRHGTSFSLVERYAAGEQGAFAVADQEGNRYVLKWRQGTRHLSQLQYARSVTERLCARKYPAPRYLYIGTALDSTYYIQTALPGEPMYSLTAHYLPCLLELNTLQIGQAPSGLRSWPKEIVDNVLYGGDGFCLHASLQQHSPATAQLLRDLQHMVLTHKDEISVKNDIVHIDFQPYNIFVHNAEVSGVIDWDAALAGDAAFDLATLLFYAYDDIDLREQLWQHALSRSTLNILSVYLAHLILRQTDWSLRFHDAATSNGYLTRSYAILEEIAQRSQRDG